MPDLPGRLTRAWQSLVKADELVAGFGERGWIDEASLVVARRRAEDLARRVGRLEERGEPAAGVDAGALARDLDELTELLVALVDAAVEAQPDLAPEVPVPVTLDHARERLGRTHDAYGELD